MTIFMKAYYVPGLTWELRGEEKKRQHHLDPDVQIQLPWDWTQG